MFFPQHFSFVSEPRLKFVLSIQWKVIEKCSAIRFVSILLNIFPSSGNDFPMKKFPRRSLNAFNCRPHSWESTSKYFLFITSKGRRNKILRSLKHQHPFLRRFFSNPTSHSSDCMPSRFLSNWYSCLHFHLRHWSTYRYLLKILHKQDVFLWNNYQQCLGILFERKSHPSIIPVWIIPNKMCRKVLISTGKDKIPIIIEKYETPTFK